MHLLRSSQLLPLTCFLNASPPLILTSSFNQNFILVLLRALGPLFSINFFCFALFSAVWASSFFIIKFF